VESVTTVRQSSDLIVQVLLFLKLSSGISEDLRLILSVGEAHVVSEVSNQLSSRKIVFLIKLRLFLLEALKHSLVVSGSIEHAHAVHFLGLLEILVSIIKLSARSTIKGVRC